MFRSATLRLTLWYLAMAMAISLLFSIALYNVTTHELDTGLHSESQSLYNQFPVFQGDPNFSLRPDRYYDQSSHRILLRLIGFNLIVLVGAGAASYWLAKRTLEPIEAAHEQQKRFTSDVSHELRTPLTAIKMESEVALLNAKTPPKELRDTISSNLEEVSKLEALINNLLRLSKLEVDELQQSFSPLNSQKVLQAAVEQTKIRTKNYKLEIKAPKSNDLVLGDQDSLVQLLVILIDNAVKYSPKGSQVTIESSASHDQAIWRVKDEGQGIAKDALEHVFDRFYRADSSRNKVDSEEGYGLGLSIAKMIADVHHGTITLSSREGKGTTATVSLPKTTS